MSAFLGLAVGGTGQTTIEPKSRGQNDYSGVQFSEPNMPNPPYKTGWGNDLRDTDVLWTRSSVLGAGGEDGVASGQGGILHADCQRWEWNFPPTGCNVRKVVQGLVVNGSLQGVAGATVQLFNTATGLLVDTQISKSDGTYICGDPNATTCFAVGYLPDSPDTEGTTVNTLTGV